MSKKMIISAFCGTGKTYLCDKYSDKCVELECWKYEGVDFPKNYIKDIRSMIGKIDLVFISTNPVVLKPLHKSGLSIKLIYPEKKLKKEYLDRYIGRYSSLDFIEMLDKNWDKWLDELKEQNYCEQTILQSGEYLNLNRLSANLNYAIKGLI